MLNRHQISCGGAYLDCYENKGLTSTVFHPSRRWVDWLLDQFGVQCHPHSGKGRSNYRIRPHQGGGTSVGMYVNHEFTITKITVIFGDCRESVSGPRLSPKCVQFRLLNGQFG